jgi:hypothetical protein
MQPQQLSGLLSNNIANHSVSVLGYVVSSVRVRPANALTDIEPPDHKCYRTNGFLTTSQN